MVSDRFCPKTDRLRPHLWTVSRPLFTTCTVKLGWKGNTPQYHNAHIIWTQHTDTLRRATSILLSFISRPQDRRPRYSYSRNWACLLSYPLIKHCCGWMWNSSLFVTWRYHLEWMHSNYLLSKWVQMYKAHLYAVWYKHTRIEALGDRKPPPRPQNSTLTLPVYRNGKIV